MVEDEQEPVNNSTAADEPRQPLGVVALDNEVTLPPDQPKKSNVHKIWILLAVVIVLIVLSLVAWHIRQTHHISQSHLTPTGQSTTQTMQQTKLPSPTAPAVAGLQLDSTRTYGNKYANNILPVGDGKYTTSGPKQGYIYACSSYAQSLTGGQGGAGSRGPWFTDDNTSYNEAQKIHVNGSVSWHGSFTNTISGGNRLISTNDLPLIGTTGIFPIAASDPAYHYDRNPNSIQAQTLTYTVNANPTYGSPNCMGGEVGVMLTGIALFNALDAGGRDAGAWEVQDGCSGHPQMSGEYHYHTLSSCITDTNATTVIGFALDGFPITGPTVSKDNILTTADLDECHGIVSDIMLDGKKVTMYHYVMTQDFPYSVSCFRSQAANPPGQHEAPTGPPRPGQP